MSIFGYEGNLSSIVCMEWKASAFCIDKVTLIKYKQVYIHTCTSVLKLAVFVQCSGSSAFAINRKTDMNVLLLSTFYKSKQYITEKILS